MKRLALIMSVSLVAIVVLSACNKTSRDTAQRLVLEEIASKDNTMQKYAVGDKIFSQYNKEASKQIGISDEVLTGALELTLAEKYKEPVLKDGIPDPVSLEIGIIPDIPMTYRCNLVESSTYAQALLDAGWVQDYTHRAPDYIDCYFSKQERVIRLLILPEYMKIFLNIEKEPLLSETYIFEG